ncbi:MAG: VanZ family protein [Lachnospiraceae bacterium]|nr:VanZ family protein [Lachnospiraceae bacterium]
MKKTKYRWIVHVLFVIYMGMLFRFTILRDGFHFKNFMKYGTVNLSLFTGYVPFVRNHIWGRFIYLFGGNIAAFIPFGAYLGYREKKIITTVIFGFLLSLFIESMQYVWGVGISELDDLILNTLGAFLGVVAVKALKKIFAKKSCKTT